MKTGKIVIKDRVYFKPDGLEKPDRPSFYVVGYGHREKAFKTAMKEYEASKQLVEVRNVFWAMLSEVWMFEAAEGYPEFDEYVVYNNQICKAEVKDNKAEIIKLL